MPRPHSRRRHSRRATRVQLGNVEPLLEDLSTSPSAAKNRGPGDLPKEKHDREVLAAFCRALDQRRAQVSSSAAARAKNGAARGPLGTSAEKPGTQATLIASLSPRVRQTLEHLLAGDSEKQIAGKLMLSRHTVHVYVKSLYKAFNVNSRGELLARFVRR